MESSRCLVVSAVLVLACAAAALAQLPPPNNPFGGGRSGVSQSKPNYTDMYGGPRMSSEDDKLNAAVRKILSQYKATEDQEARAKLKDQLGETLEQQFKVRADRHEREIAELEAKVKKLRSQLDRRRQMQREIIDFRLQQLIREADGLGWGTDLGASPGGYSGMKGGSYYSYGSSRPDDPTNHAAGQTYSTGPKRGKVDGRQTDDKKTQQNDAVPVK